MQIITGSTVQKTANQGMIFTVISLVTLMVNASVLTIGRVNIVMNQSAQKLAIQSMVTAKLLVNAGVVKDGQEKTATNVSSAKVVNTGHATSLLNAIATSFGVETIAKLTSMHVAIHQIHAKMVQFAKINMAILHALVPKDSLELIAKMLTMLVSNQTSVKMVVRVALMVNWDLNVYVWTVFMVRDVRMRLMNVSSNHVQMEQSALIRLTILNVYALLDGWGKRVRLMSTSVNTATDVSIQKDASTKLVIFFVFAKMDGLANFAIKT